VFHPPQTQGPAPFRERAFTLLAIERGLECLEAGRTVSGRSSDRSKMKNRGCPGRNASSGGLRGQKKKAMPVGELSQKREVAHSSNVRRQVRP
jgi:hypothetical protein